MKRNKSFCVIGAFLMLGYLSLDVQYLGATVDEENIFQNEQPLDNELELINDEEAGVADEVSVYFEEQIDEEAGLTDEAPFELEEQIVEVDSELMGDEEAEPLDENFQEELEQNIIQEEYKTAE